MRLSPLVPLACLALLAAGCGERPEPLGAELSPYPVEVQGAGPDPTRLERRPERIVALNPGTAEIVDALGAGRRLVGVPAGVVAADAQQVTRPSGLVDVAAVVGLEPDLITAAVAASQDDLDRAVRRTRAAVYLEPSGSYAEVVRAVRDLGFLVGEPVAARRLTTGLREQLGAVAGAVGDAEPVPVFVDGGLLVTVEDATLVADIVRRAGGRPVGTDQAGLARDPCDVVALGPALVLRLTDTSATRPPAPRLDRCPGGEGVRIEELPAELVTRAGPRVGEALERVARLLHPDAF
jgi:iron complex transport system substrate-binding protein